MNAEITIRPNRLNLPLPTLVAGRLSSAVITTRFDVPSDCPELALLIDDDADGTTQTTIAGKPTGDGWRFYCVPGCFPEVGERQYYIVANDDEGNARWLGTGMLRILENPANGSPPKPDVLPHESYAYNPLTGLYHKLTAVIDEAGVVSVEAAEKGVAR